MSRPGMSRPRRSLYSGYGSGSAETAYKAAKAEYKAQLVAQLTQLDKLEVQLDKAAEILQDQYRGKAYKAYRDKPLVSTRVLPLARVPAITRVSARIAARASTTTALVARAGHSQHSGLLSFDQLEPWALQCILKCLPADVRMMMALVSPRLREAVNDKTLWAKVDLSLAGADYVNVGLLRAISAKAAGEMQILDVSGRCLRNREKSAPEPEITVAALKEIISANAGSLHSLHVLHDDNRGLYGELIGLEYGEVLELANRGTKLRLFEVDAECQMDEAHIMLTNTTPFECLRLRRMKLQRSRFLEDDDEYTVEHPADLAAEATFSSDIGSHVSLRELRLHDFYGLTAFEVLGQWPDTISKVSTTLSVANELSVLGMLTTRLTSLTIEHANIGENGIVDLASIISAGRLSKLCFSEEYITLSEGTATFLADALRLNTTLTVLRIPGIAGWDNMEVGAMLVDALVGHPCMRTLVLSLTKVADDDDLRLEVGISLGTLIVETPSLTSLDISYCGLGDECLRHVFYQRINKACFRRSTNLRELYCTGNNLTRQIAPYLLEAVTENTSLRILGVKSSIKELHFMEAEELVCARNV